MTDKSINAQPLVSIVIPTYNQMEYLASSIESVLNQRYYSIEIIVLNDGSTDGTADVLKRYTGNAKIRIDSHANMGQAATINKGWRMSRGNILGYLSSDDVLHPDCIKKVVQVLESDAGHICAFPNFSLIDDKSRMVRERVSRPFSLEELVVKQECYIGPGALFRRRAFDDFGGWKEGLRLGPDREYWMRISSAGTFAFLDEDLAGYRYHLGSISYKPSSETVSRQFLDILDDYFSGGKAPKAIEARRNEAYGHANLRVAVDCFRSGNFLAGLRYYKSACELHPDLRDARTKVTLLKSVIGKPIRRFISKYTGITRLN